MESKTYDQSAWAKSIYNNKERTGASNGNQTGEGREWLSPRGSSKAVCEGLYAGGGMPSASTSTNPRDVNSPASFLSLLWKVIVLTEVVGDEQAEDVEPHSGVLIVSMGPLKSHPPSDLRRATRIASPGVCAGHAC